MATFQEELMEQEIERLRKELDALKDELASARLKPRLPRRIGFEDFKPSGVIVCFETADGVTEFMTEFVAKEKFGEDVLKRPTVERVLAKMRLSPGDPASREYRRCDPERIMGWHLFRFREVVPVAHLTDSVPKRRRTELQQFQETISVN